VYLKEIELENFKSFKGKLKLPLSKGYTAITGPNGCGKSNISDAILFVLGPKSSKAIRAGRLTDLIFNGGKGGSAAQYCRVSLLFDNSDNILPVASDIVKLTRLVKKSKSQTSDYLSYFYVNDKKSALNEFDSILSHAKISAEGYNMVQQGDINRIVSMGPKERRTILDDIAGISRFDADIEAANKDRLSTEENLDRINIILDELGKQLKQLESDRGHALKYKEQKEKLDTAKAQLEYKRKESLENEINGLREQAEGKEKEIASIEKKKKDLEEKKAEIEKELADAEESIAEKSSKEAQDLRNNLDAIKIEVARSRDGIENSKNAITELKARRKQRKGDLDKVVKDLDALGTEKAEVEKKYKEVSKKLEAARKESAEHEKKLSADGSASPLQKEVLDLKKKIDSLNEGIRGLSVEKDRLDDKCKRLESEIDAYEEKKKEAEFQLKDADWRLKEMKSQGKKSGQALKDLQDQFYKKRKEEENLTKQSIELENAIKSLTRDYNQLKAQSDAVKSVQKGMEAAVSSVLEARDKGELKGIKGSVSELISVNKDFETAIFTAAGQRMQAIVVDDDASAERAINFLKKGNIGRAMFLPLNKMLPARPRGKALLAVKGSRGFAIDLVKFDEEFRDALGYVFGDTIVVDDLAAARERMGGVRLVTLEGDLVEASGAMIGGMKEKALVKPMEKEGGQLKDVAEKLRKATSEADKLTQTLSALRLEVLDLEKQLKDVGISDTSGSAELDSLEAKRKEYKGALDGLNESISQAGKELEKGKELLEKTASDLDGQKAKLAELDSLRQKKEKEVIGLASGGLGKAMKELQERIGQLVKEDADLSANLNTIDEKMKMANERLAEVKSDLDSIDASLKSEDDNVKGKTKKLADDESKQAAMEKIEKNMDKELIDIRTKRDEIYKLKTDTEGQIDKFAQSIETKGDFIRGLKVEIETATKNLEEMEKIVKELNIASVKDIPSTETLNKSIRSAESAIESLGNVNMRALEAYDEQDARYKELKEELDHLKDQKKRLVKLVEELTDKKKEGFYKVFEGVNLKFKEVYAQLSEGGEAELVVENPDNPFEGGMLINAKPPGKKVHVLDALSGGEKGLVSMALIFAIQRFDPSPFYLLDEVDQNLDAINAENVARMIKRNSEVAQFLQISLRKITLQQADHLMGVTMQKQGVSDIIMKVNLGDLKEPPGPAPKGTG
jgi:chromosome segregation protein